MARPLSWIWALLFGLFLAHSTFADDPPPKHDPPPNKRPPEENKSSLPKPPPVDKRSLNVGGLVANVYGLEKLAPIKDGSAPDIHVLIHLHGRTRSAEVEEPLTKNFYGNVRGYMTGDPAGSKNDFLVVSFDAPNHGHRTTLKKGQVGYEDGNKQFGIDQYALIVRDASDASYLIDFLPFYLFPKGERNITNWIISGRNDPRVTIGTVFIGMPDYYKLLKGRTAESDIPMEPPFVPDAFVSYVNRTDPAHKPYDAHSSKKNPFWDKKIFVGSGGADPLVHFSYSSEFLEKLVLGPKRRKSTNESLEIYVQPDTEHRVTKESAYKKTYPVLDLAGRWVYRWSIAKEPVEPGPPPKVPGGTHARPPPSETTEPAFRPSTKPDEPSSAPAGPTDS